MQIGNDLKIGVWLMDMLMMVKRGMGQIYQDQSKSKTDKKKRNALNDLN